VNFCAPIAQRNWRREVALESIVEESLAMREIGKFFIVIGTVTVLIGLIFWGGLAPKWLGRLPGDVRIERGNSFFYFPIVTCTIISIVLSLLLSIFRR
jgi:hypothetical protein